MRTPEERIWAYLHDELSPGQRESFEQVLRADADLCDQLATYRGLHQELEQIIPFLDEEAVADEQFEQMLLAEWEKEHPEFSERENSLLVRKTISFMVPAAAAAAALIFLMALPRQGGPIHWEKTIYGEALQHRGQEHFAVHYERDDLEQISRQLRSLIEAEMAEELSSEWILRIQMQELAGGALALEVSGHPRGEPDVLARWYRTFLGEQDIAGNLQTFARQTAEEIASGSVQ